MLLREADSYSVAILQLQLCSGCQLRRCHPDDNVASQVQNGAQEMRSLAPHFASSAAEKNCDVAKASDCVCVRVISGPDFSATIDHHFLFLPCLFELVPSY